MNESPPHCILFVYFCLPESVLKKIPAAQLGLRVGQAVEILTPRLSNTGQVVIGFVWVICFCWGLPEISSPQHNHIQMCLYMKLIYEVQEPLLSLHKFKIFICVICIKIGTVYSQVIIKLCIYHCYLSACLFKKFIHSIHILSLIQILSTLIEPKAEKI